MAERGRPSIKLPEAYRADRRFEELRAEGMGINNAEEKMLTEGEWKADRLNCRQAVRKRRERLLYFGFMATVLLADLSYLNRRD